MSKKIFNYWIEIVILLILFFSKQYYLIPIFAYLVLLDYKLCKNTQQLRIMHTLGEISNKAWLIACSKKLEVKEEEAEKEFRKLFTFLKERNPEFEKGLKEGGLTLIEDFDKEMGLGEDKDNKPIK